MTTGGSNEAADFSLIEPCQSFPLSPQDVCRLINPNYHCNFSSPSPPHCQPGVCADNECPFLHVMCRNELLITAAVASLAGTTLQLFSQQEGAEELGVLGISALNCEQDLGWPCWSPSTRNGGSWQPGPCLEHVWCV